MSWIEQIKDNIIITTGDGKKYEPLYVISSKTVDYNVAEFEFPNIKGTLVNRGTAKGARFAMDIFFQGENHLDEVLEFESSNDDRRPWNVFHPVYGSLILQPTSLTYDPTGLNNSKVSAALIETITDDAPKTSIDALDKTKSDILNSRESLALAFSDNVIPTASDITKMNSDVASIYALGASSVKSGDQSNEYLNIFNKSKAAILNAVAETSIAATLIVDLFVYPSLFKNGIKNRLLLLKQQFEKISLSLDQLNTPNNKAIYELQAGGVVLAMINASVNPDDDDFQNSNDVLFVIQEIVSVFDDYVLNLDSLQTDNGGELDSYIPNFTSLSNIVAVLNFSTSQLYSIALTSQQERILFLENDSNVVTLTHRFYGMDEDDSNMQKFMEQNNIGLNELLGIKKGRKLIYYV